MCLVIVLEKLQTSGLKMPRVMIKGGVWRNTEDEIMKVSPIGTQYFL